MNDTNNPQDPNMTNQPQGDEAAMARENLKAVLQVGLTIQMVSVITAFAIKKGKEDFLKKLNDLLLEFNGSLSNEEKKELSEDSNRMVEQKAQELVDSLGEQMSSEELEQVIQEMKQIAQQPPTQQ